MSIFTKPTELPRWSETAAGVAGGNITDPPSGNKDSGWLTNGIPPASWFNWWMRLVYKWVQYGASVGAKIGSPWIKRGVNGAAAATGLAFAPTLGSGAGLLVATAGSSANFYVSDDGGLIWTLHANNAGGATMREIGWNGTTFVAVGTGNAVCTSTDGSTWVLHTGPHAALALRSIAWNGSVWCCGISNGKVGTSPDGITWTEQTTGLAAAQTSVVWGSGPAKFVAMNAGLVGTSIATSADGTTWTLRTAPVAGMAILGYLGFATPVFIATGNAGGGSGKVLYTSPDGITWTSVYTSTTSAWLANVVPSAVEAPSEGAVFGGANNRTFLSSGDGVTWAEHLWPMGDISQYTSGLLAAFGGVVSVNPAGELWLSIVSY